MKTIFTLLLLFQAKHWLADYPLQGRYMLGKFRDDWGFVPPLFAHVCVHGLMTFAIVAYFRPSIAVGAMFFDMTIHFVMDRVKAASSMMGRWHPLTKQEYVDCSNWVNAVPLGDDNAAFARAQAASRTALRGNRLFWLAVGFDQAVHHLTHYAIIYAVVR